MRRILALSLPLGAAFLIVAGCATHEEWEIWKSHPYHFASGSHFGFSMRNRAGAPARVTRNDIELARQQDWFGKAITVSQEQLLEK